MSEFSLFNYVVNVLKRLVFHKNIFGDIKTIMKLDKQFIIPLVLAVEFERSHKTKKIAWKKSIIAFKESYQRRLTNRLLI